MTLEASDKQMSERERGSEAGKGSKLQWPSAICHFNFCKRARKEESRDCYTGVKIYKSVFHFPFPNCKITYIN